jgi:phenylacetate-CoA ligase
MLHQPPLTRGPARREEATPRSATPAMRWPAMPPAAGQAMLALQFQLDLTQWWSPDALAERQFAQLHHLLHHALATVPHYRELAVSCGIDAGDMRDPATFGKWPSLRKAAIQAEPDRFMAERLPAGHGGIDWTTTSGSSGQPLRAAGTDVSRFFQHALLARSQQWYGLDHGATLGAIRAVTPGGRSSDWGPPANAMYRTGPSCSISAFEDHRVQLEWIRREQPVHLVAHNTNIHALLRKSVQYNLVPTSVRTVLGFGDMPVPDTAADLGQLWGARYFDTYSCSEIGPIALQCPEHGHLHVQSEHVLVEILRDDGTACEAGETGRVVITDLHNFAMPFIRYELGDYARAGAPCPCGRGLPVIDRIIGRAGQLAVDPTGRTFFPHLNHGFWVTAAPILQRQIVQLAPDELEIRYVAERDLTPAESDVLDREIRAAMRYDYRIRYTRVETIAHSPGGKFDDFISLEHAARRGGRA